MANFFVPRGADKSRYSMTSEGGFEHPWKLTVNVNETLPVGLWGGYDNDEAPLKLSSNNPGIVTVIETTPSFPNDRILSVRGKKPGFTILDANGAFGPWCSMQIEVRQGQAASPGRSQGADEIDFEVDPETGELVHLNDPKAHKLYVDRVFTAVAYGILPDGYYVYCEGMELPINVPESMVDFELATAECTTSQIYDSFNEAKLAANDSTATRRVAFFWGAGGAVVSPTIIGPATTPQLYSTIIAVRELRDVFVSVMLPAITMAIGMIGGPKPMTVKGNQGTGRIAKKGGGTVPPRKNAKLLPRLSQSTEEQMAALAKEHPGLSTVNAERALRGPNGAVASLSGAERPGAQIPKATDIEFRQLTPDGNVVLRREVKVWEGGKNAFNSTMSKATEQVRAGGSGGEIFLQAPDGTSREAARSLVQGWKGGGGLPRDQQAARLGWYRSIRLIMVDKSGTELLNEMLELPPLRTR
jgi:hypothetical protein